MPTQTIPEISLAYIYKILLERETETCGFLLPSEPASEPPSESPSESPSEEHLLLKVDPKAKEEKGSCKISEYKNYIWHTHPKVSKAYLSSQDILMVIKKHKNSKGYPRLSIVFTSWGIWEVFCEKKIDSVGEVDPRIYEYIHDRINREYKDLYYISEKGRGNLNEKISKELQRGTEAIIELVNHKFRLGLKISFTPWEEIKGDYVCSFL